MAKSNGPQLGVTIKSDTSQFSKGLKGAKSDLKNFERSSNDALRSLGEAFGVPTAKLDQMAGSVRELGRRFGESENAGTKAFGKILQGCNGLAAGIAGLGIGAAIASFKALRAEAENFGNTVDGLNMKLGAQAWIDTYRQAMHDANASVGQTMTRSFNAWRKQITEMGGALGAFVSNGFNLRSTIQDIRGSKAKANDAAYETWYLADAQKELLNVDKQLADLESKIAAARLEAYDTRNPEAIAELTNLINQRYAIQEPILRKIYEATKSINGLSGNTVEDVERENAAYRALTSLTSQRDNDLKSLLKLQKGITAEVTKQKEETDAWAGIIKDLSKEIQDDRTLSNFWLINSGTSGSSALTPGATTQAGMEIQIPVRPVYDKNEWIDLADDVKGVMSDAFVDMSSAIGSLVGDLVSGGDAWGNFANSGLEMLAEMATSVGKIAITMGTTLLAIKTSLKTMNPWVAIAAGAGLVALGAAVRSGLSNAADNVGSAAASTSGIASSYGGSDAYATTEVTVKVDGTLRADGNQLVAVINNSLRKNQYTF